MKFDLSKFKKIKQDQHTTTLKHPEGHTINIAHTALSPKMKAAFAALPMHKEEGGEVEDKEQPKAKETPKADPDQGKDKYKEFEKGATKSGYQPKDWLKNLKEGLGMAEGGIAGEEGPVEKSKPSQYEKFKTAFAPPEMGYDQDKAKEYRNEFVQEMPGAVAGSVAPVEGAAEDLINPIIKKLQTAPETLTPAEHQMLMDKLASIKPSAEVPAAVEGASEASKATPVQMIEPTATKPAMRTPDVIRSEMNAEYAAKGASPRYGALNRELEVTMKRSGKPYAKGGKVQNYAEGDVVTPPTKAETAEQNARDYTIESGNQPAYQEPVEDPALAKSLTEAQTPSQDVAQPQGTPEQAKTLDPETVEKQDFYNKIIANNFDPMGNPRAMMGPAMTFGPGGEPPKNFNPEAWTKAEQMYALQKTGNEAASRQKYADAVKENEVRARAGLPALDLPKAPAAPVPSDVTPSKASTPVETAQAPQGQTPYDPFGTEQYYGAMARGIGEQRAGIFGEAAAQQAMAANEAKALQKSVEVQAQAKQSYQDHFDALNKERQAFIQDYQNQHIDPNHYLNSKGTVGKITTAIGLILGGAQAQNFLHQQINNDIDAQRAELGKRENLLSANMRQYGNLRDAMDMTRVMQNDIVSNQLKMEAAKATGPLAKARALQAAGQLDMQTAPILSQLAMRRTLLGGMKAGQIPPERIIYGIVPEKERSAALKELQTAQTMNKAKDNILSAFDQASKINTVSNRLLSPIQAKRQVAAITKPIIAGLSKETAGRFTEADAGFLESLFPSVGDTTETLAKKRAQITKLVSEKMNFPTLRMWGIDLGNTGRYNPQGAPRFNETAPAVPKK